MFPRPLPSPNPLTEPYWQAAHQRELKLPRCRACAKFHFYPRSTCPHCGSVELAWQAVSGKGEVYSYTLMNDAPAGFEEQAPYYVGLIKLNEGPLVTAQLTDLGSEKVEIGMPVEMVTRRIRSDGDERGMLVYGYKFRPELLQ